MKKNCILPILIVAATFYLPSNFLHGAPQEKNIRTSDVKKILKENSSFFESGKVRKNSIPQRRRNSNRQPFKSIEFQFPKRFYSASRKDSNKKNFSFFKIAKDYIKNDKLKTEKPYLIAKKNSERNKKRTPSFFKLGKEYLKNDKIRTERAYLIVNRNGKGTKKSKGSLFKAVRNYQKSSKRQSVKSIKLGRGRSKR